jgi:photoactive yellow protein
MFCGAKAVAGSFLMMPLPTFDTPKLAVAVEALTQHQMDSLPFGVIGLDAHNVVRVYNKTEAECSGFKERTALGRLCFVDVAPCLSNSFFKGRIEKARKEGVLDIRFSFVGDFSDSERELTVRAQSGKDGGFWIFIQRA